MKSIFLGLCLTCIATLTSAQSADNIWTAIEPSQLTFIGPQLSENC